MSHWTHDFHSCFLSSNLVSSENVIEHSPGLAVDVLILSQILGKFLSICRAFESICFEASFETGKADVVRAVSSDRFVHDVHAHDALEHFLHRFSFSQRFFEPQRPYTAQKIRKFAHREQADREQSENSKTEATLILCGSSGERANNFLYFLSTYNV